jgi:hypothetical protein
MVIFCQEIQSCTSLKARFVMVFGEGAAVHAAVGATAEELR